MAEIFYLYNIFSSKIKILLLKMQTLFKIPGLYRFFNLNCQTLGLVAILSYGLNFILKKNYVYLNENKNKSKSLYSNSKSTIQYIFCNLLRDILKYYRC